MKKYGVCFHFRGIQFDTCRAGVDWRAITGGDPIGIANRMPCFESNKSESVCAERREPTTEEVKAEDDMWQGVIDRMRLLKPVLSEWRKKEPIGKQEIIECPACHGKLHLSQAECNGHVHGKCETDDCYNWME